MEKAQMRTGLRYDGFEQTSGNVRRFSFHWAREDRSAISVDADLSHFAKYHVGVQDGPALCVRKVLAETATGATGVHHDAHVHLELLEADIRDFSEACLQEIARRKSKAGRHIAKAFPAVLVPQSAPNPTDNNNDDAEGEPRKEADPASGGGRGI